MYAFQSIISFFPIFLREYHGFGETTASLAFSVMFALMAIGLPVTGTLADRHGTQTGIAGPMTLTALSIGVLLLSPAWITTYAGIAGVGLGITWGGSIQSRFMRLFSSDERGTGFGLVRSVFVLLGAVGNVTTGYLAEVVGWLAAFAVVGLVLLFAVVLLFGNQGLRNPQ
jgi:MFS family permease